MKKNFEKEVYYFTELVFKNIQSAKTKAYKTETILHNLIVKSNEDKIIVFNAEKNYSYILWKKEIQNFNFKQYLTKYLALLYFNKLNSYLNNKITFKELADIEQEVPPIVKNLLKQKTNISEQLKLLRKHSNIDEVKEYVDTIYNKYATDYMKYLIDRYYYNKKGLTRPQKTSLEKMFKLLLH